MRDYRACLNKTGDSRKCLTPEVQKAQTKAVDTLKSYLKCEKDLGNCETPKVRESYEVMVYMFHDPKNLKKTVSCNSDRVEENLQSNRQSAKHSAQLCKAADRVIKKYEAGESEQALKKAGIDLYNHGS